MIKRTITYTTFDDQEITEDFYFNISKPELIELEASFEGGMGVFLDNIIKAKDQNALLKEFKRIILMAYGEKSDDGRHFFKSDEMRHAFSQSAAYEVLYMELVTDDKAAAEFLIGAFPRDFANDLGKKLDELKAQPVGVVPGTEASTNPEPMPQIIGEQANRPIPSS